METNFFEKAELAGIKLKNRIIRSATHEGFADERGFPTEKLKTIYQKLAKGGVGAIVTGYAGVRQDGKSPFHRMLMIDSDESVPLYKDLVDSIHEFETPIILQIAHCGRQTRSRITGFPTVAPSAIRDKVYNEDMPHELTEEEIDNLIVSFAKAVERAKNAGFDGVQLHLAHGYLLSSFLSPSMNRRKDRYGGDTANRYRIIGEIFSQSRELIGNYPIFVKLNAHDGQKNGMRVPEAVAIAKLLEESGCSGIEVSCGVADDGFYSSRSAKPPVDAVLAYNFRFSSAPSPVKTLLKPVVRRMIGNYNPLYLYDVDAAHEIKKAVSIPITVVGGIRTTADIKEIFNEGKADFVAMSRPFILEPDLVNRFKEGKQEKSRCIDCCYCALAIEVQPLCCLYGKVR